MDVENSENLRNASSETSDDGIVPDSYTNRILAAMFLIISTVGTVGNTMVIIAVLLSRKLQTPPNVFVVSLAVADLVTCFFIICKTVALFSEDGWPFPKGEWLCAATAFTVTICIGVSLLNLAAISVNRYVLVTKPYSTYQKFYSSFKIGLMVLATWIIPFAIQSMTIIFGGKFEYNSKCTAIQGKDNRLNIFSFIRMVYILVVLVMIFTSYALVFRHVRNHLKKKRQQQQREGLALAMVSEHSTVTTTDSNSMHQAQSGQTDRRRENAFSNNGLQVTKNLAIVVAAFLLCFILFYVIRIFNRNVLLHRYTGVLIYSNSAINPIIYARRHPHFKKVFEAIVKCQLQNIPEPTDLAKTMSTRVHPMN